MRTEFDIYIIHIGILLTDIKFEKVMPYKKSYMPIIHHRKSTPLTAVFNIIFSRKKIYQQSCGKQNFTCDKKNNTQKLILCF
jgi:hypothetical protein